MSPTIFDPSPHRSGCWFVQLRTSWSTSPRSASDPPSATPRIIALSQFTSPQASWPTRGKKAQASSVKRIGGQPQPRRSTGNRNQPGPARRRASWAGANPLSFCGRGGASPSNEIDDVSAPVRIIVGRSGRQTRDSQRAKAFQKLERPLPATVELGPKESEGNRRSSMVTKRGATSGIPDQNAVRCPAPPNGDCADPAARGAVSDDKEFGGSSSGKSSAGRRLAAVHKRASAIASRNRGPAASVGVEIQGRSTSPTGAILGCRQSTLD